MKPAGVPTVFIIDDDRAGGDEQKSLIYSMRPCLINAEVPLFMGQVVEFLGTKPRGFRRSA